MRQLLAISDSWDILLHIRSAVTNQRVPFFEAFFYVMFVVHGNEGIAYKNERTDSPVYPRT